MEENWSLLHIIYENKSQFKFLSNNLKKHKRLEESVQEYQHDLQVESAY